MYVKFDATRTFNEHRELIIFMAANAAYAQSIERQNSLANSITILGRQLVTGNLLW